MTSIYILKLEDDKYYVGKTNNPDSRIKQHFEGHGSEWTKMHKPVKVIKVYPNCDDFDEDKYTISYMKMYGINNVRGGSFCRRQLTSEDTEVIKKMISGASNECLICGSKEHFCKDCEWELLDKSDVKSEPTQSGGNFWLDLLTSLANASTKSGSRCFKCHKVGHYANNCRQSVCGRCGRDNHKTSKCYAKTHLNGRPL